MLTTGRQDYGILRSTLELLGETGQPDVALWAGGMLLSERFGRAIDLVRADGLTVSRELPFVSDPPDQTRDTARALAAVGDALAEDRPDALMLVGDRYETAAAAIAATLARVPIVHLHGGEETEGAIDNAFRHAITKLSHLHLVSHPAYAARVRQMGEPDASVIIVGSPGTDNLYRDDLPSIADLEKRLGRALTPPIVLVTMHPTTLGGDPRAETNAVAEAMARVNATYVITAPNTDTGGTAIDDVWRAWTAPRANALYVDALGATNYWALLRATAAVLGNSSSGILEAPSAGVPVVNVGDRQQGRIRMGWVRDVPAETDRIEAALREALAAGAPERASGRGGADVPRGPVAPRIVDALRAWDLPCPPRKRFVERVP